MSSLKLGAEMVSELCLKWYHTLLRLKEAFNGSGY